MKLDLDRIETKIQFIKKNLSFLQGLTDYSESEFVKDMRNFYSAVHALQISIEAMLDVFTHIVARLHLGAPSNDHETLQVARDQGLINAEQYQKFFDMNKFRNKVVHGYLDVDAKKIYKMLHHDLGDFQLFFDAVRRVVEREQAKEKNSRAKKTNSKK